MTNNINRAFIAFTSFLMREITDYLRKLIFSKEPVIYSVFSTSQTYKN